MIDMKLQVFKFNTVLINILDGKLNLMIQKDTPLKRFLDMN